MIRRVKVVSAGLLLLIGLVACGPVHQTVRPDSNNLGNVKKIAIVIPPEGEFTVFYERATATAAPAIMFGLVGAIVASAHNKYSDEALAKTIGNHMDGFSCRSVFKDSLIKSLIDSKRFSEVQVFDKELELGEISKYDGLLTFQIPNWGIRLVERGQNELLAAFVEIEAKMVLGTTSNVIWDEHDTVIGQNKRLLSLYQNEQELCRKDLYETAEDAGQRMANILIYR
jgi:hypothetical protein